MLSDDAEIQCAFEAHADFLLEQDSEWEDFFWVRSQGNSIDRTAASGLEKYHHASEWIYLSFMQRIPRVVDNQMFQAGVGAVNFLELLQYIPQCLQSVISNTSLHRRFLKQTYMQLYNWKKSFFFSAPKLQG